MPTIILIYGHVSPHSFQQLSDMQIVWGKMSTFSRIRPYPNVYGIVVYSKREGPLASLVLLGNQILSRKCNNIDREFFFGKLVNSFVTNHKSEIFGLSFHRCEDGGIRKFSTLFLLKWYMAKWQFFVSHTLVLSIERVVLCCAKKWDKSIGWTLLMFYGAT